LGEGRGEGAALLPAAPPRRHAAAPRGFTIVELLVVAGLIAVLAALVTPAVIRARSAARNAAIKAEIDMLHMAIMTYRNEYGSFPPCVSPITSGSAMARHLQRLFPRCDSAAHLTAAGVSAVSQQNAIFWWLSGYTSDPTSPLMPASGLRVLFDFDRSRLQSGTIPPSRNNPAAYAPAGRPGSPYLYFDAPRYGTSLVLTSGSYTPVIRTGSEFFNPDSFQILCAGQDGIWNNDDDLSNFWRGTRAQHAASSQ
jgi:prepilin-type N-terminal cleavage/methylation domain-containing protein